MKEGWHQNLMQAGGQETQRNIYRDQEDSLQ